jgi:hypothetical protein
MSTVNSEIQTIISAGIKPPSCRQPVYNMYYNRYEVIYKVWKKGKTYNENIKVTCTQIVRFVDIKWWNTLTLHQGRPFKLIQNIVSYHVLHSITSQRQIIQNIVNIISY